MSLTAAEKNHFKEVLEQTGAHRKQPAPIPDEYRAYLDQVDQQEVSLPLEEPYGTVRLVISTAKDKMDNCPIHINMHGGGFYYLQDHDDDLYCAHLAAGTHGIVVDIDYASSWDQPFPGALEQCYRVTRWVFDQCRSWGGDLRRVSIGGHSAGGCLAMAISMRAAATGDFALCLQVLDYAALDSYSAVLPGGNPRGNAFSMLYGDGDPRVLQTPFCSPAFATDDMLKGLPPTLFINGQFCPFKSGNEQMALRMAAQGNEVTIRCFLDSPHGFTVRRAGQWQNAQNRIIQAIQEARL